MLQPLFSKIHIPATLWNAFHTIESYPFGNGTPSNVLEIHTIDLLTIPHYYMVDLLIIEDYAFHAVSFPPDQFSKKIGGVMNKPYSGHSTAMLSKVPLGCVHITSCLVPSTQLNGPFRISNLGLPKAPS